MDKIVIRAVKEADLSDITRIHIASFKDRALSQMGFSTVRRYYAWLLTGFSMIHPVCAVNQEGIIAGYCFSGLYAGSFSGFLKNNKGFLIKQILKRPRLLFNPIVQEQARLALKTLYKIARYDRKNKSESVVADRKEHGEIPTFLGILSIAVDPVYQRLGIAGEMMASVKKWAIDTGFKGMNLSVHQDNLAAIRFYEKLGFNKVSHTEEWKGEMRKLFKDE